MSVNDVVLPVFVGTKYEINKRTEVYERKIKEYYPSVDSINEQEYQILLKKINNCEEGAIDELYAKTLGIQLNKIKKIYTKYDIEDILPLDEGISSSILEFHLKLLNNDGLPQNLCDFEKTFISLRILRSIKLTYQSFKSRNENVELYQPNTITYVIDKTENEPSPVTDVRIKEVSSLIDKSLSRLTRRNKIIIQKYFGLNGYVATTMENIGKEFGITTSAVQRIIVKYLSEVRNRDVKKLENYKDLLSND